MPELRLFVVAGRDFVPHQMKDLFGARLKNLGQDAARHYARLPPADARDFHRLVLVHHAGERAAALALHLLGVRCGRAQADGDVVQ